MAVARQLPTTEARDLLELMGDLVADKIAAMREAAVLRILGDANQRLVVVRHLMGGTRPAHR